MSDNPPDLTLSSRTLGDTITLDRWLTQSQGAVWLREGSTGLMGIPRSVRYQEGAGDGGRRLGIRAKVRPLLLKLAVYGGLDAQRTTIDRLRRIVLAEDSTLTATIDGESWTLGVSYDSGLEGDYSLSNANSRLTLIDLAMTAPQPFWEAVRESTQTLVVNGGAKPFLSSLANLPVAASNAGGDYTVECQGDAAMPVRWTLTGPAQSLSVDVNGTGFACEGLAAGEQLTVDTTRPGTPTVTDSTGADAYTRLSPGPRFPLVRPGANSIRMRATGGTGSVTTIDRSRTVAWNWVQAPLSGARSYSASQQTVNGEKVIESGNTMGFATWQATVSTAYGAKWDSGAILLRPAWGGWRYKTDGSVSESPATTYGYPCKVTITATANGQSRTLATLNTFDSGGMVTTDGTPLTAFAGTGATYTLTIKMTGIFRLSYPRLCPDLDAAIRLGFVSGGDMGGAYVNGTYSPSRRYAYETRATTGITMAWHDRKETVR